jgi:hypothetical protein
VKGIWGGGVEKGQCLQDNIHYYEDNKNTNYHYKLIDDLDMDTYKDTDTENFQTKNIPSVVKQYGFSVTAFIFIFGATGNVIIIIIIICNKDMRTVSNMYTFNLVISDVIYSTMLLLDAWRNVTSITCLREEIGCAFFAFCYRMSVGLTAYSVAVLSIQRYSLVVKPLHVHVSSQPTWRGTWSIICGVWIVAVFFTIPTARSQFWCQYSGLLWITNYYYHHFLVFQLLVFCVFPLCVIAFSYIMTARHLVESFCSVSDKIQNNQMNTRKNTAKVVLGLTVVFLISYVPFYIAETCVFYSINFHIPSVNVNDIIDSIYNLVYIREILKYFLSINSCLIPVALFCTSHAFRRHFKRYLTCCCKTKPPPTDFELTRRN